MAIKTVKSDNPELQGKYGKHIQLLESMNESDRRAILMFMQSFATLELYDAIQRHYDDLCKYEKYINPLSNLLYSYANLKSHLDNCESDCMHFAGLSSYALGRKSENYDKLTGDLRKRGNEYRKWITEVIKDMPGISLRYACKDVNKEGIHYKTAVDIANKLSELWFIKKIILFGSVARGEEKLKSDIDLAIELIPKLGNARISVKRLFDGLIGEIIDQFQIKYYKVIPNSKIFNVLCTTFSSKRNTRMFEMTGFFDNSIILYDRVAPLLSIVEPCPVNIDDIFGVIPNAYYLDYNDYNVYYCFFEPIEYKGDNGSLYKAKMVKFHDNEIVFYGNIQLPTAQYRGCMRDIKISSVNRINENHPFDPQNEVNVLASYISEKLNILK
jgi:predicted nucleotidyltransferase